MIIKRGDVFYADLDPIIGSEQGGIRPVLVVQNNVGNKYSPTVVVLPISSAKKINMPTHIRIFGSKMLPSPRVTQSENPRYTFRCWLIRIGLNGDEFKNCRKHLLSHLEGNIAWLHPEDAIKQRERLKQERITAREQRVEPVRDVQEINGNVSDENIEPSGSECEAVFEDEEFEQEETFEMSM